MIVLQLRKTGTQRWQDRIVIMDIGEQRLRSFVAAMRRFGEVEVKDFIKIQDTGGLHIFGATKGHIVDVGGKPLVELASERKTGRRQHSRCKSGGKYRVPAPIMQNSGQAATGEDHVIEVR